ncbi:MAG: hypothetical protein HWQ38_18925 [Nostoc sp. NMS7]|uniref:hypothetical protein n=1 Tax=Nostoc sp. NMS7 TaxID=2815391 RepID=UPI0025D11CA9|nr:hypothetical protein [Nostoc sp. NMS7]MBN3948410.1 hypothetical protein [Nostoc sp. NMS7]
MVNKFGQQANQQFLESLPDLKQKAIAKAINWRQEDYHGRHSTLYVAYDDGSVGWEVWQWCSEQYLNDPMDFLDRINIPGVDHITRYRLLTQFANCVQRTPNWSEVNRH